MRSSCKWSNLDQISRGYCARVESRSEVISDDYKLLDNKFAYIRDSSKRKERKERKKEKRKRERKKKEKAEIIEA